MKKIPPVLVLFVALIVAFLCIYGDNSFEKLASLRKSLEVQREKNIDLGIEVNELKREVHDLHSSSREIEKAARNELGMARPNELIFFFDKESKAGIDRMSKDSHSNQN